MFFFVEIAAVQLWAFLIIIKHACEDPEIVSRDDMVLEAEPLEFYERSPRKLNVLRITYILF